MSQGKPNSTHAVRQTNQSFFFESDIFSAGRLIARRARRAAWRRSGPRHPRLSETDVLVVGGGPAGTAAAIAAGGLGADVLLVERYNHLGGLSTGGLVIWIDRMTDWSGRHVIRGIANELMERLPKDAIAGTQRKSTGAPRTPRRRPTGRSAPPPTTASSPGRRPSIPKRSRRCRCRWWARPRCACCCTPGRPRRSSRATSSRAPFSRARKAATPIFAKVVIDTTGDADLIARTRRLLRVRHRRGRHPPLHQHGVSAWAASTWSGGSPSASGDPDALLRSSWRSGAQKLKFFEKPFVSWRNDVALFMGPRLSGYSAVDVEDLTDGRAALAPARGRPPRGLPRAAPGFANAFLMLGAPADRRAPQPAPQRLAQGHAPAVGYRQGLGRRDRRVDLAVAEVSQHLRALRRAGAGGARQHPGRRPARRLRRQLAHLPARDPAMLADRTSRRCRGSAGGAAPGVQPRAVPVEEVQADLMRQGAFLRVGQAGLMRPATVPAKVDG